MSAKTTRYRPELEACEPRLAMSTGAGSSTLAIVHGAVRAPRTTAEVSFPVTGRNLSQRHSVVLGTTVQPGAGSTLIPAVKHAHGPSGRRLAVHQGMPFIPGVHNAAQAFVRTGQAGPLTTGVTGRQGTTGAFQLTATLPGDLNGDGQVTQADLKLFAKSYLTVPGDANYNPAADANHNGFVGHGDVRLLLRNETPLTPKHPLSVQLTLAPKDAAPLPHSTVSGGATHKETVTILGHTTPGSIVFADSGLGDYTFTGQALVPDAQGNFSIKVTNKEGLNNYNFLAIDPYGQQIIRDFPIFWIDFAASGSKIK